MNGIDWQLAARIGRWTSGELPKVTSRQAAQHVASLRVLGQQAGELALRASKLDGAWVSPEVVDRDGWLRHASRLVGGFLSEDRHPLLAKFYGAGLGASLGLMSRALLGQYDAFSSRLFLNAPNIFAIEQSAPGPVKEFRLWVCGHEQTHAVQFTSTPWLAEHLRGQIQAAIAEDGRDALNQLTATMTFLEGHADFVADRLGFGHIGNAERFRKFFARKRAARPRWLKAVPYLDKALQYELGLDFARAVNRDLGRRAINAAFSAPDALPTAAELRAPQRWMARVHGKA